jgi:hypothetical protein
VTRAHGFRNQDLLYRFTVHKSRTDFTNSSSASPTTMELVIVKAMQKVGQGLNLRSYSGLFGFKVFKDCFTGQEAVRWLIDQGLSPSENDCVRIGNRLLATGNPAHDSLGFILCDQMDVIGLIEAAGHTSPFKNVKDLLFRFHEEKKSNSSHSDKEGKQVTMDTTATTTAATTTTGNGEGMSEIEHKLHEGGTLIGDDHALSSLEFVEVNTVDAAAGEHQIHLPSVPSVLPAASVPISTTTATTTTKTTPKLAPMNTATTPSPALTPHAASSGATTGFSTTTNTSTPNTPMGGRPVSQLTPRELEVEAARIIDTLPTLTLTTSLSDGMLIAEDDITMPHELHYDNNESADASPIADSKRSSSHRRHGMDERDNQVLRQFYQLDRLATSSLSSTIKVATMDSDPNESPPPSGTISTSSSIETIAHTIVITPVTSPTPLSRPLSTTRDSPTLPPSIVVHDALHVIPPIASSSPIPTATTIRSRAGSFAHVPKPPAGPPPALSTMRIGSMSATPSPAPTPPGSPSSRRTVISALLAASNNNNNSNPIIPTTTNNLSSGGSTGTHRAHPPPLSLVSLTRTGSGPNSSSSSATPVPLHVLSHEETSPPSATGHDINIGTTGGGGSGNRSSANTPSIALRSPIMVDFASLPPLVWHSPTNTHIDHSSTNTSATTTPHTNITPTAATTTLSSASGGGTPVLVGTTTATTSSGVLIPRPPPTPPPPLVLASTTTIATTTATTTHVPASTPHQSH